MTNGHPSFIDSTSLASVTRVVIGRVQTHTFMKAHLKIVPQLIGVAALIVLLTAGCSTSKPKPQNFLFFPPAPDEPRIQYLMSFGSENELGGNSKFNEFLLGEEKVYRPIWKPYGVAIQGGKIYVCDTQAGNISIADIAKRKMRYLRPEGQAAMKVPVNLAVDKDGTIYVADTGRSQVLVYDKDGNLIEALGKRAEMQPGAVAVTSDRLYITDMTNHCVRVYSKADRKLLFTAPRDSSNDKIKPFGPTNIAVDQQGRMYVSDTRGFNVKIYDADGNHLRTVGDLGVTPGQFTLPKGIGADHEGRFYVVDAAAPVVQFFDAEGRLLMFFGQPNSSGSAGLYLPAGLAVDYENVGLFKKFAAPGYDIEYLILLTNQIGPQKVSVFGYLRKG
jgi:DNA-binding beta-propeller fold protein YncE